MFAILVKLLQSLDPPVTKPKQNKREGEKQIDFHIKINLN